MTLSKVLGLDVSDGADHAENGGLGHHDVELPQRSLIAPPSRSMPAMSGQVERDQRRHRRGLLDLVVQFLEPAHGARHGEHMRARRRELLCQLGSLCRARRL